MRIYGKDYHFRLTVGASVKLARLCPEDDITKIGQVMSGSYPQMVETTAKMAAIMSEADELARRYEAGLTADPAAIHPLTEGMVLSLSDADFLALQREVFEAYRGDAKPEVEEEPVKKKEGDKAES